MSTSCTAKYKSVKVNNLILNSRIRLINISRVEQTLDFLVTLLVCVSPGPWCTYLPLVCPFQHSSSLAFPAVTLSSTHIASGRLDQNFFDSFSFSFMSTT